MFASLSVLFLLGNGLLNQSLSAQTLLGRCHIIARPDTLLSLVIALRLAALTQSGCMALWLFTSTTLHLVLFSDLFQLHSPVHLVVLFEDSRTEVLIVLVHHA